MPWREGTDSKFASTRRTSAGSNVRLEVDRDGKVTSRLVVDRPETLNILRQDAPALERSLQQAGLKTADDALQFSLRDQGGFGGPETLIPPMTDRRRPRRVP